MRESKPNGILVGYIREARKAGLSDVVIVQNLVSAGWKKSLIRTSLAFSGSRQRVKRAPSLSMRIGERKRKYSVWKICAWLAFILLGVLSLAWLIFHILVIQGKSVLGYSFIRSSVERSFALPEDAARWRGFYSDPQTLQLSRSGAVVGFQQVHGSVNFTRNGEFAASIVNGEAITQTTTVFNGVVLSELVSNLLGGVSYESMEQVSGRPWLHYNARLDLEVFRGLIARMPDRSMSIDGMEIPAETVRDMLNLWADGADAATITFSVDLFARKITAFQLAMPAPSLAFVSRQALTREWNQGSGGEGKKVLDTINNIQASLEKFKQKYGGYPEGLNGVPKDFISSFQTAWPPSQTSTSCSDYYQDFTYVHKGNPIIKRGQAAAYPEFNITFCMPEDSENVKAGVGIVTVHGILTSVTCPSGVSGCFTRPIEILEDTTGGSPNTLMSAAVDVVYPFKE